MSSFLEYPDQELNDAKTDNVIAFSMIVVATILLLSLLLTILGCVLLGFRRNSFTVSKAKRRLKQEIKRFNLKSSTVLAKNQKSLRYLASHPHYEDKFIMLSYVSVGAKGVNEVTEEFIEETEFTEGLENNQEVTEGLEDNQEVTEGLEEELEDSQKVTEGLEDIQQTTSALEESKMKSEPPKYVFPKYLIASAAQKQSEQPVGPAPDYVFPKLISITKKAA